MLHLYSAMAFPFACIKLRGESSAWDLVSSKTLEYRPRDYEFDPLTQLNLIKGDTALVFPGKMLPCIRALHWTR